MSGSSHHQAVSSDGQPTSKYKAPFIEGEEGEINSLSGQNVQPPKPLRERQIGPIPFTIKRQPQAPEPGKFTFTSVAPLPETPKGKEKDGNLYESDNRGAKRTRGTDGGSVQKKSPNSAAKKGRVNMTSTSPYSTAAARRSKDNVSPPRKETKPIDTATPLMSILTNSPLAPPSTTETQTQTQNPFAVALDMLKSQDTQPQPSATAWVPPANPWETSEPKSSSKTKNPTSLALNKNESVLSSQQSYTQSTTNPFLKPAVLSSEPSGTQTNFFSVLRNPQPTDQGMSFWPPMHQKPPHPPIRERPATIQESLEHRVPLGTLKMPVYSEEEEKQRLALEKERQYAAERIWNARLEAEKFAAEYPNVTYPRNMTYLQSLVFAAKIREAELLSAPLTSIIEPMPLPVCKDESAKLLASVASLTFSHRFFLSPSEIMSPYQLSLRRAAAREDMLRQGSMDKWWTTDDSFFPAKRRRALSMEETEMRRQRREKENIEWSKANRMWWSADWQVSWKYLLIIAVMVMAWKCGRSKEMLWMIIFLYFANVAWKVYRRTQGWWD
ncbi:hypothetical protein BZA77DRAFT_360997 [Pyronema omphalodes]|nr:hypothetical protein BZA77DRAFT_360997 [Pyronema omphalodes]